ncbi:MAG: DUF2157 domain-containing protein [Deltaproteobacteria bacterium]|nr:DUF2157 domain-containing protein [Deltaproteobacteria bacterium]
MNRRAFVQHLKKELPALVADGVIDDASAERLRERYGTEASRVGLMSAALSSLGALLVGGGVILVIAHNWSEFPRAARAALSFLPLASAIALTAFAVWTGRRSAAWREGLGIFYTLSSAASIALVSQTYNIQGSGESFLFAWALFALPVVYLLDSAGASVVWLGTLSAWFAVRFSMAAPWAWFAFAAAFVPWLGWRLLRFLELPSTALAAWAGFLSLLIAAAALFQGLGGVWSLTGLAALLAGMHLTGEVLSGHLASSWKNPALVLGRFGSLALLLTITYPDVWRWTLRHGGHRLEWAAIGWVFFALFSAGWMAALWVGWTRRARQGFVLGAMPLAILAIGQASSTLGTKGAALAFDLYGLTVGAYYLCRSTATRSLADLNLGMGLIAVLAILRFFDSNMGILARGLTFIAIGTAFLVVNRFLARRWEREAGT